MATPEIFIDDLSADPSVELPYVVRARVPQLSAGLASCKSSHRAEIVADALRVLAETDPTFAQRVQDATLAERRADSSPELKRPIEWANERGWLILGPDGWRKDGKPFDEPITETEFLRRASMSTVDK